MTAAAPDIAAQSPIKLKAANLPQLVPGPSGKVTGPSYPRRRDRAGIVHLGVGGFHRAHMGVYVDRLLALTNGESDAICGVGLLPSDAAMMEALAGQDHLYTVLERGPEGVKAHVVGAMVDYLHAPSDPEAVLARLASPETHLVSMTITESGYMVNEATGELDLSQPNVQHDLSSPRVPKSVYGYLCQALARRRQAGMSPFTVLSCDNVQKNGDLTRRMLLTFAREVDPTLAEWIAAHGAFPNSMVDRITPRTTPEDCALLRDSFGIDDAWPVVTEPYSQWVLEDRFVDGRPAWDQVGVQMVQDVEHYELMKLRLLNGGHSALAYLGWLAGYRQVHEVVADPLFRRFLIDLMRLEVQPLLPAIPGIDLDLYCETLLHRFSNANMADQVARLCWDGSGKLPKFILPSVQEQLQCGGPMRRLALCVAAWMRYLTGIDEQGQPYKVEEPMLAQLQPLARKGGQDPSALLHVPGLFHASLRTSPVFVRELGVALEALTRDGAQATIARLAETA